MDDVKWRQQAPEGRNQNDQNTQRNTPGDEEAGDIVGRTGEEMPEVAHDETGGLTDQPDPDDPDIPEEIADR